MFQFLNNVLGKSLDKQTLAELVAENQKLGREIDEKREQRRLLKIEIEKRIAKGER